MDEPCRLIQGPVQYCSYFCVIYNMNRIVLFCLLAVFLLSGCEKPKEKQEKPFYPAEGAVNARYSIGDTVTVVFAQGNLQYQASTRTWRFASNQYDVIGYSNELVDTNYAGWIDLFGWGTSGYNELMPYTVVDIDSCYVPEFIDIAGTDYDWGRFNVVSNGGNKRGVWRTMKYDEWRYLFFFREDARTKRGLATIESARANDGAMCGLLLLPDKWELPEGCTFQYGTNKGFETNRYTIEQWNRMHGAGAVFLPAGGYRDKYRVSLVGEYGCYWASTYYDKYTASELYIQAIGYGLSTSARSNGHSVRLVQER